LRRSATAFLISKKDYGQTVQPHARQGAWQWAAAVLFRPRLAGATLKDRLVASLGPFVGIGAAGFVSVLTLRRGP